MNGDCRTIGKKCFALGAAGAASEGLFQLPLGRSPGTFSGATRHEQSQISRQAIGVYRSSGKSKTVLSIAAV